MKMEQQFLLDLLHTPSPSGQEEEIQKKWLNYVKPYAHEVNTDIFGNAMAILNPKSEFKVLLAGHCDEIGFMITKIDDDGFLSFCKVGGISHKIAPGMKVKILNSKKSIKGIVGVRAEHQGGLKDKFEIKDLFIDCGATNKEEITKYVQVGDYAIYDRGPEVLLNDRLTGRALDNRTGAFIIAEVIKNLKDEKLNVGVYAVSTISEEVGLMGAYAAAAGINPSIALACDVTFSTDHPSIDNSTEVPCELDKGPVLAIGAAVNKKVNQLLIKAANSNNIPYQLERTISGTGTDADRMKYTNKGVAVSLVSLPLRYMHSPVEMVSLKDIELEIKLLVEMIKSLSGKEDLRPVVI